MKNILFLLTVVVLGLSSCRNIRDLEVTGVKGVSVSNITTNNIEGNISLGIKNPNNFGFSIFRSEFDVIYAGIRLGKAKLTKRVRIRANSEEVYRFRLAGDFKDVSITDVMQLLSGATRKSKLELKGNLRAGKLFVYKSFPVEVSESLNLK